MQDETINRSNSAALEVRGSAAGTMKLMVLCALALLFAASILMDDYILSGKAWIVSWLLAPLAPFVFLLLLWRLIKGGVQLRIDDQGIHYPRWSAMPVRWDDIGHVVMTKAFPTINLASAYIPPREHITRSSADGVQSSTAKFRRLI